MEGAACTWERKHSLHPGRVRSVTCVIFCFASHSNETSGNWLNMCSFCGAAKLDCSVVLHFSRGSVAFLTLWFLSFFLSLNHCL